MPGHPDKLLKRFGSAMRLCRFRSQLEGNLKHLITPCTGIIASHSCLLQENERDQSTGLPLSMAFSFLLTFPYTGRHLVFICPCCHQSTHGEPLQRCGASRPSGAAVNTGATLEVDEECRGAERLQQRPVRLHEECMGLRLAGAVRAAGSTRQMRMPRVWWESHRRGARCGCRGR